MSVEFITPPAGRPGHRDPHAHAAEQPFTYPLKRAYAEPDWTRLPAYRDVSTEQWESAQWQRAHTVKNLKEFKAALGDHLDRRAAAGHRARPAGAGDDVDAPAPADDQHDGRDRPPGRSGPPLHGARLQRPETRSCPSHPFASRDSLHEADMWAVEGLTHRYPTKVLAELIPTCPQYCGHCTRMDLVGNDTAAGPQVQVRGEAERAVGRDARLPAAHAQRPRRRGVRRRHGQRPDQAAGDVRDGVARHRERPRHPPRHEGPDGDPAALPPGRREGVGRADGITGQRSRGGHRRPHPRERRAAGDATRRHGRRRSSSTPGSATCATRACCSAA